MNDLINWIENHSQACFFKKFFGFECPGCGMQRAFIELLKGNLHESIMLYPPLLPILFLFTFFIVHLIFRIKYGAEILKYAFSFTVIIVFVNYLLS